MKAKWALFFSGKGSNLQAVLQKFSLSWSEAPILVTNNPKAGGLEVAKQFGLQPLILDFKRKSSDQIYSKLHEQLTQAQVQKIFLLGYLKILPSSFIDPWQDRIFNLHPSLLPKYPGLKSIERAFAAKQDIGVSIHRVTSGVDEGQVLMQKCVLTAKDYDPLSLDEVKALVHSKEHEMVCDFILQGDLHLGAKKF